MVILGSILYVRRDICKHDPNYPNNTYDSDMNEKNIHLYFIKLLKTYAKFATFNTEDEAISFFDSAATQSDQLQP